MFDVHQLMVVEGTPSFHIYRRDGSRMDGLTLPAGYQDGSLQLARDKQLCHRLVSDGFGFFVLRTET